MIQRIKTILCHPRYTARLFGDSFKTIFTILLGFFVFYIGISCCAIYSGDNFTNADNNHICKMIMTSDYKNTYFNENTNTLSGEQAYYASEYYTIYVLPKNNIKLGIEQRLSLIFHEDKIEAYYSNIKLNEEKYSDLGVLSNFNFRNIKDGNLDDKLALSLMLTRFLDKTNNSYSNIVLVEVIIDALIYSLGLFVFIYFTSIMINPTLERNVRAKLALYQLPVFYLINVFSIMFNIEFLTYLALFIPMVYSISTYSRIIKVK